MLLTNTNTTHMIICTVAAGSALNAVAEFRGCSARPANDTAKRLVEQSPERHGRPTVDFGGDSKSALSLPSGSERPETDMYSPLAWRDADLRGSLETGLLCSLC